MQLLVSPGALSGVIPAIPSKSYAHRLLIAAALSAPSATNAPRLVTYTEGSEDISATCRVLRSLGACVEELPGIGARVTPIDRAHLPDHPELDCGESGTTLRYILPIVAALGCGAVFLGHGRLPQRPLEPLSGELKRHGIKLEGEGNMPLRLSGALPAGDYTLPGDVSSQFIGGLLIALTLTPGTSTLTVTKRLESAAYVRMTLEVLEHAGVRLAETQSREHLPVWHLEGVKALSLPDEGAALAVEGDWSNAAFWLCAGALGHLGTSVTVTGLNTSSLQGDRHVLDVLEKFGATVLREDRSVTVKPTQEGLRGCTVDVSQIPDLLPILAVTAAGAKGTTTFTNAARLRIKESDRLATTSTLLSTLSVDNEELPEGLIVRGHGFTPSNAPKTLSECTVSGAGDHRIVMAAAVAATAGFTGNTHTLRITGAQACAKSYPAFPRDLARLGGKAQIEKD